MVSPDLDLTIARLSTQGRLTSEIDKFSSEIALVLRNVLIQGRRETRVVPGCGLIIVSEILVQTPDPLTLVSVGFCQIDARAQKIHAHYGLQSIPWPSR